MTGPDVWADVGAIAGAAAALIAFASAWYSRQSAIAAKSSAMAAQRAVELTQSVRLLLTNNTGGYGQITLDEGVLRLWVTNGGHATVIIDRVDLVSRVQVRAWWALPFLPNRRGQGYARIRYLGEPSRSDLKGGGADGGTNVAQITMRLSEARATERWEQGAFEAPDPARAILEAKTDGARIAIEIRTQIAATGVPEWHTIAIRVQPLGPGKEAEKQFLGKIEKGTIIDRERIDRG